jgi:peptidoglycan hydrolase CwlO-like protein
MPTLTKQIIEAAITGFESQREKLAEQIAELRAMLDGSPKAAAATSEAPALKRRGMSKAGREAIAAAQRKRWAAKKKSDPTTKTAAKKPKRKMSKEGRAAIVAAVKRRWAAKKAAAQG